MCEKEVKKREEFGATQTRKMKREIRISEILKIIF